MANSEGIFLSIPRDAYFPSLTRAEDFNVYAHAYWFAAEKLFETYWDKDGLPLPPDFMVLPTLYLLHHFIELELKEVLRLSFVAGKLENKPVKDLPPKGSHSLTSLLEDTEGNLREVCPDEEALFDEEARAIIEDLEKFGRNGEALRYPETIPSKGSEPTLPESFVADVRAVMKAMKKIRARFNGCIGWLDNYVQFLEDVREWT